MTTTRSYGDACGVAIGLDVVGERWALLVVRELLLGPRRFTDLRAGLPGASPNVLSQRLRELEAAGVLQRRKLAPPAGSWVYELTPWGAALEPVVIGLGSWALRAPAAPPGGSLSVVSAVLTLRTFFVPERADFRAGYELRFGEDRYAVRVDRGTLATAHGPVTDPVAALDTDARTFVNLLGDSGRLPAEIAAGTVELTGDSDAVTRLLAAVSIPAGQPGSGVPNRPGIPLPA